MSFAVRRMRPGDLAQAMEILGQWNMAPRPAGPDAPRPEREHLDVERSFVAVAGEDERVVGVCSYIVHDPELAETASLAVRPEYRGSGAGFRLQQARLDAMRALGIRRVRTETDREETAAWYQRKFGSRVVGTSPKRHAFSRADVHHWTVLELDLGPPEPQRRGGGSPR